MRAPEPECRRLLLAVVVSVLLHAGWLMTVVTAARLRFDVATKPIEAVITVVSQATAAVPVAAVSQHLEAAAPSQSPSPGPARTRETRRQSTATPALSTKSAAAHLPAPQSAVAPAPTTAALATPSTLLSEGVSADELRQYRVALAIAARRFKRYPPLARERGWQGSVEVALSSSNSAPRPQLTLSRSSGHVALDEQALAMIEQAAANTLLPEDLRGRNFRLLLPIEFSLDDDR